MDNIKRFNINKYNDQIIISNDKLTFKTREFECTNDIKKLKEIKVVRIYGSLLYYIFGCRVAEGAKYYNSFQQSITLNFNFDSMEKYNLSFSIGDDFQVKDTNLKIKNIINHCKTLNRELKVSKKSKLGFF